MECVTIYTDGSYKPQTDAGGWGAVIIPRDGHIQELSGGCVGTSVLRMEITAVLEALEHLKKQSKVLVYTDSLIIKWGMTEWLPRWQVNGWVNGYGESIIDRDLWERLDFQCEVAHVVVWNWVRRNSSRFNRRADRLAREGRRRVEKRMKCKRAV